MNRFNIYSSEILVGHSALETGDPPMGCAFGRFFPLPAYDAIQQKVIAAFSSSQKHLSFAVVVTESGLFIPAQGGIQILDASTDIGPEGIEVHVSGIAYPLYEQLFPGRHATYEASFSNVR